LEPYGSGQYPVTGCCEHGHESCGYIQNKIPLFGLVWLRNGRAPAH